MSLAHRTILQVTRTDHEEMKVVSSSRHIHICHTYILPPDHLR